MSLTEKCNEFISNYQRENDLKLSDFGRLKFMEAFYAGAKAYKDAKDSALNSFNSDAIDAEIDHFRKIHCPA